MPAKRVMCVDDSPIMLAKLQHVIESLGYDVCATVLSGNDAIRRYDEVKPDMVGMDGIETTRQILNQHPEARIIVVTSHGQEQMVVKALKAGAKGYVMKPVQSETLNEHLVRALTARG